MARATSSPTAKAIFRNILRSPISEVREGLLAADKHRSAAALGNLHLLGSTCLSCYDSPAFRSREIAYRLSTTTSRYAMNNRAADLKTMAAAALNRAK